MYSCAISQCNREIIYRASTLDKSTIAYSPKCIAIVKRSWMKDARARVLNPLLPSMNICKINKRINVEFVSLESRKKKLSIHNGVVSGARTSYKYSLSYTNNCYYQCWRVFPLKWLFAALSCGWLIIRQPVTARQTHITQPVVQRYNANALHDALCYCIVACMNGRRINRDYISSDWYK